MWETNFVSDLGTLELLEWEDRGPGSTNIIFALADGIMHAHVSEVAPATYKKAHRHMSGDADFIRVDWKARVASCRDAVPPALVTSNVPSRYLATGMGRMPYPFTAEHRRAMLGNPMKNSRFHWTRSKVATKWSLRIETRTAMLSGSRK
jgi:hypothetical protein